MRNFTKYFALLLIFASNFVFSQIPCGAGFNANGTTDFITIPNTDAINIQNTRNRTVEFWIKPSDITTRQVIYEEGAQVNVIMFFIEGGRLYAGAYRNNANADANRRFFRSEIGTIAKDKWTHVAFTLQDTATPDLTLKWFLDGVEKDSQNGLQVNTHSGDISIGRNGGNIRFPSSLTTNWTASSVSDSDTETYSKGFTGQTGVDYNYNGKIALFRIWNVARTPAQISDNKSTFLESGTSLVAYQDGDQMHYEANNANSINSVVTANQNTTSYTWTGLSSTVFNDNNNWVGNAPDVTKTQTVIINNSNNNVNITTEVTIGRLTVNEDAEIVIKNGGTLNVYYSLTNNGKIIVEDGGALIYHACNNTITGNGTFDVQRATPDYDGAFFFSYWSSPVVEADANPSEIFPDAPFIFEFLSSEDDSDWVSNGGANLKPGIGYAVRNENVGGELRTFSGTINQGKFEMDVFYSSNVESENEENEWSTQGDNLVGNPYASALSWDLIITDKDNKDIEGTVYFWNQNSVEVGDNNVADYLQYNLTGGSSNSATGNIGSGQGFFVRTLKNSKITFKTTHQIAANNNQFFKGNVKTTSNKGRSWFSFTRGNKTNTLLVGFLNGATNDYDRVYDAPFNANQTSLGFYSIIDNEAYRASIQGLPELKEETKEIKLGYIVDQVGEHTISIQEEHINSDYYIYLRDMESNEIIDLRKSGYSFNIDTIGENNTRFQLIYTKKENRPEKVLSTEDISLTENTLIYVNNSKELIVDTTINTDKILLFDMLGAKVKSYKSNNIVKSVSDLKTGIYFVQLTDKSGATIFNQKILVVN